MQVKERTSMYFNSIISSSELGKLLENGSTEKILDDHIPIVKLYLPLQRCIFLLTHVDTHQPSMAFGLFDFADGGSPMICNMDINGLEKVKLFKIFRVRKDEKFQGLFPISVYAKAAYEHKRIIEDKAILKLFQTDQNSRR